MSELQAQLDANWTKIESEISASAERFYWQARLFDGHRVPTRQLMRLALAAIEDFNAANIDENSPSDVARFVRSADAWLTRERGRIWAIAQQEEAQK